MLRPIIAPRSLVVGAVHFDFFIQGCNQQRKEPPLVCRSPAALPRMTMRNEPPCDGEDCGEGIHDSSQNSQLRVNLDCGAENARCKKFDLHCATWGMRRCDSRELCLPP